MAKLSFKDLEIKHLYNKKLKHSYISISANAVILLKSPYKDEKHLQKILSDKEAWIRKKLLKLQSKKQITEQEYTQDEFKRFQESILEQCHIFAQEMSVSFSQIKFRKMKRRWGSCNSLGVITFNSRLLHMPQHLTEYVIVHELAHLEHMNHSKQFHDLVKRHLKNAKECEMELRNYLLNDE